MNDAERRRRIRAIAEIIDDFLEDDRSFVLVVFPKAQPDEGSNVEFDVISSHEDREYVGTVLHYVVDGVDQAVTVGGDECGDGRLN